MYYVYALVSQKDKNLYIGFSRNVEKRLAEHNSGRVKSTRGRVPFRLAYKEVVGTLLEARKREKYLKSGVGREFLKRAIFRSSSGVRAADC